MALNSIMFLLIHICTGGSSRCWSTLNSIMFLLIRSVCLLIFTSSCSFKFHYVSINSNAPEGWAYFSPSFKFHYVSINSNGKVKDMIGFIPLNSIMFLLIQGVPVNAGGNPQTLNSIMFLLIPFLRFSLINALFFKFHYVSINSFFVRSFFTPNSIFKFHYVSINSKNASSKM